MRRSELGRVLRAAGLAGALLGVVAGSALAAGPRDLAPTTRFAVRPADPAALQQVADLRAAGDRANAALVADLTKVPQAAWFTSGTANQVRAKVRRTVRQAARRGTVPVLVAYFIPGRDCAQYSAGGALTQQEYLAWIDGFAQGIGNHKAVVILEPDGLGLIPSSCGGPRDGYPFTDEERFAELNGAVDRLEQQPKASVYLDGTHSHWLAVGDISKRLVDAGVHRAQGFFVNLSNYQPTSNLVSYGTWISKCIAFAENADEGGWRLGHYDYCGSQYYPAAPTTEHLAPDRRVVRREPRKRRADRPLRDRHEPQRPRREQHAAVRRRALRPARVGGQRAVRRELVQPAGLRRGPSADREHPQPAARRLPLGEDRRRVRRLVQRRRRRPGLGLLAVQPVGPRRLAAAAVRPALGAVRPGRRRVVPPAGTGARAAREPAARLARHSERASASARGTVAPQSPRRRRTSPPAWRLAFIRKR